MPGLLKMKELARTRPDKLAAGFKKLDGPELVAQAIYLRGVADAIGTIEGAGGLNLYAEQTRQFAVGLLQTVVNVAFEAGVELPEFATK